jgi:hypothetical protein
MTGANSANRESPAYLPTAHPSSDSMSKRFRFNPDSINDLTVTFVIQLDNGLFTSESVVVPVRDSVNASAVGLPILESSKCTLASATDRSISCRHEWPVLVHNAETLTLM